MTGINEVIVSEEAYRQMFQYVIEFANPNRPYRQWREVIGWLVGKVQGETVHVMQAMPMTSGNSIFVEITDYTIIPKIAEEAEKINAVIVGWFHSHPSFGFFLSGVDIRTQRNQQSLFGDAIAIVCDPTKITNYEPGMHVYQVYMDQKHSREYRELDIRINTQKPYPDILQELLLEKGIERSYADTIAAEDLAALYALEGIAPPQPLMFDADQYLPEEQRAEPKIVANYVLPSSLKARKDCFIQIRLKNVGEGIAWGVDVRFNAGYDFELKSMYPHRIIEQLNYDSTIIETYKIKPKRTGELFLPQVEIAYRNFNQIKNHTFIPSVNITCK